MEARDAVSCSVVADCTSKVEYYKCIEGECVHKKFWPLLEMEWVGLVCIWFLVALSNLGGIGGGGLCIPLIILFNDWGPTSAAQQVPFYNFLAAFVRFFYNLNKKHPLIPHRTVIDYNMVAIFVPFNLLGRTIGDVFNIVFPVFIVDVCLFIFFCLLIWRITAKGVKVYKKETITKEKKAAQIAMAVAKAVKEDADVEKMDIDDKLQFHTDLMRAASI